MKQIALIMWIGIFILIAYNVLPDAWVFVVMAILILIGAMARGKNAMTWRVVCTILCIIIGWVAMIVKIVN